MKNKNKENPNYKLPDVAYFYTLLSEPDNKVTPDALDNETGSLVKSLIETETKVGYVSPQLLKNAQDRVWNKLKADFDIKEYNTDFQLHSFSPQEDPEPSGYAAMPKPVKVIAPKPQNLPWYRSWPWPRLILGSMVSVTLLGLFTLTLLTLANTGTGTSLKTPLVGVFVATSTSIASSGLTTSAIPTSGAAANPAPSIAQTSPKPTLAISSPETSLQPQATSRGDIVTPAATMTPPTTPPRDIYSSIVLTGFTGPVTQVAWSPDSKFLAASSSADPTVRVWKAGPTLQATTLLGTLQGHQAGIVSLQWSPDGKTLASGSKDGTIKIWDISINTNTSIKTLNSPGLGPIQSLSYAQDGKTLAVAYQGTANIQVVMWRTADWTLQKQLDSGTNFFQAYNLKWSPDGAYLAGGLTLYKLWKADGTEIGTAYNGGTPAWGLAWSPDSKRWAVASESSVIYLYDTAAKQSSYFNAGNGDLLDWSPDGKLLASGQYVITLTKTDNAVLSESDILIRPSGPAAGVASLAWSPDGQRLATGENRNPSYNYSPDDNSVVIWNRQGQIITVLTGHTGPVGQVAWSPDGKLLASGSDDKQIRIWQIVQ